MADNEIIDPEVTGHKKTGKPVPESHREDPAELLPGTNDISELGNTCCRGCGHRRDCRPGHCHKAPRNNLYATNWLATVQPVMKADDLVEVSFKNTRKGFFRNVDCLPVEIGEMVVVESNPGFDIGKVTMVGPLVINQMKRSGIKDPNPELARKLLRKASPEELADFEAAKALEHDTMIKARKIAVDLGLNMKIGDVEYQGDGHKAIFYYIADERVDFRQLIRVLAERFRVRIEMRQIGARQEAGRIGGIGPCGRPLCCATWLSNFVSVTTAAARFQDLSLNMQKLAGQCGKLKCCLNFEVDTYMEAIRRLPDKNTRLETDEGSWFTFKVDVFKREFTFSSDKAMGANLVTIDADRVDEILEMNRRGEKPQSLLRDVDADAVRKKNYNDILEQDNLTRFDKKSKKKKKKNNQRQQSEQPTQPVDETPQPKQQEPQPKPQVPQQPKQQVPQPKPQAAQQSKQPQPQPVPQPKQTAQSQPNSRPPQQQPLKTPERKIVSAGITRPLKKTPPKE